MVSVFLRASRRRIQAELEGRTPVPKKKETIDENLKIQTRLVYFEVILL